MPSKFSNEYWDDLVAHEMQKLKSKIRGGSYAISAVLTADTVCPTGASMVVGFTALIAGVWIE